MNSTMFVQQMQSLNIGIDFFCALELTIILFYIHHHSQSTEEYILFRYIIAFTILAFIGDGTCWLLNGLTGTWINLLNYLANYLYMTCQLVASMLTFVFIYWIVYGKLPSRKFRILGFELPLAIMLMLTYTTPMTGLIFTINHQNFYQRGPLFTIMSLTVLTYIFAGSFLCAVHIQSEVLQDRKRRMRILACYCIPVIMGSLAQTAFYGISLVLPCSGVALFMIFINEQDLKISVDTLTGLNNRGCFDRYLNEQLETSSREDIGLIMIDVNNFKNINDKLGHVRGDQVLQMIADILRQSVENKNVFLARYGGDEFTLVLHTSQVTIETVIKSIARQVKLSNIKTNCSPEISLAVGSARYNQESIYTIEQLIHEADNKMYEEKRMMKQMRCPVEDDQKHNELFKITKKKF